MRLIDADKLLYDDIKDIHGNTYMIVHAPDIDMAPTAFDREKVIEELQNPCNYTIMAGKHFTTVERAIEIVEKGGIE